MRNQALKVGVQAYPVQLSPSDIIALSVSQINAVGGPATPSVRDSACQLRCRKALPTARWLARPARRSTDPPGSAAAIGAGMNVEELVLSYRPIYALGTYRRERIGRCCSARGGDKDHPGSLEGIDLREHPDQGSHRRADDPVKPKELQSACLSLPAAYEDFPFGEGVSVFKVAGKMFALCPLHGDPLQLSVKCEPELAVTLRASYPAITAGYHLNKRHWNTITLDGSLPDQMVLEMMEDSYGLVVASLPRKRRPS